MTFSTVMHTEIRVWLTLNSVQVVTYAYGCNYSTLQVSFWLGPWLVGSVINEEIADNKLVAYGL